MGRQYAQTYSGMSIENVNLDQYFKTSALRQSAFPFGKMAKCRHVDAVAPARVQALNTRFTIRRVTHFRIIVLKRLAQMGRSRYWLVEQMGEPPTRGTVYAWLNGSRDLPGRHLERMFRLLNLGVVTVKKR